MLAAAVRLAAVLLVTFLLLVAVRELTWNAEENKCAMTYMREMPEYIPIKLSKATSKHYPHYALYLYGEGYYATAHRASLSSLSGTPVLFVPGNGGSYQQARSLGSVSLVAAEQKPHKFDHFTIDFNEELVALYGGNLRMQTAFVALCVKHILHLYEKHSHGSKPTSVVLVGHSMGGLLARAVFTLPSFDKSSVQVIVTQVTPHQSPVVSIDNHLDDFYSTVNQYWRDHKNDSLAHVIMVSTGGGVRDVQVAYHLAVLDELIQPSNGISVSTTAVPGAWLSTDHLCAVWCLQMVVTTVQALFHLIDSKTNQFSETRFLTESLRKRFTGEHEPKMQKVLFNDSHTAELLTSSSLSLQKYRSSKPKYYIFAVPAGADTFYAVTSKPLKNQWIIGCRLLPNQQNCTEGVDLSELARPLPPAPPLLLRPQYFQKDFREALELPERHRLSARLAASQLSAYTHVALLLPSTPGKSSLSVHAELFGAPERAVAYHVPGLLDLALDFPRGLFVHVDEVIAQTDPGALFYNVSLVGLESMYQAYTARLSVLRCSSQEVASSSSAEAASEVMQLHLPWSKGADTYSASRNATTSVRLSLTLQAPLQPAASLGGWQPPAQLHLHLQPDCVYSLHVDIAFTKALAQFVRHYFLLVPAFVIAILVVAQQSTLCAQPLPVAAGTSSVQACWRAISWSRAAATLVIPSVFASVISRVFPSDDWWIKIDAQLLHARGFDFLLLPLCLQIVSYVAAILHLVFLSIIVKVLSVVFGVFTSKISLPHWFSCLLCYGLMAVGGYVAIQHCASFGLVILHGLHVAQVLCGSTNKLTDPASGTDQRGPSALWMPAAVVMLALDQWLLALTFPSFLQWAKYIRFSWQLQDDPWIYQAVARILCALFMQTWGSKALQSQSISNSAEKQQSTMRSWQAALGAVVLAITAVLYCSLHLHRLTWIIVLTSAMPLLLKPGLERRHLSVAAAPASTKTKAD